MKGWPVSAFRRIVFHLSIILLIAPAFQACGVMHPNRMLDTDKDQTFQSFLDTSYQEFIIQPGDILEVYIFPNGGYNLIESQITTLTSAYQPQTLIASLNYTVDAQGEVNLPRAGEVKVGGLTESQAEKQLSTAYATWYNDAFVNVYVRNKFVTVYRGSFEAKRVEMTRPDITILEAIGMAGGIPESGKSSEIKIIRKINGTDQVQLLDLSDMKQIALANAYVLPNDVVYIEPSINAQFFREIAPIFSTVSGIAVIYAFFVNIGN